MYNKVIMIGNLTRDIDLKYLPSGTAIAKSAIATSHRYKTNDGEQKEEVCFLDFNVFGKSAEILNQYVKKGSKVLLEGRLVFESWVGPDGNNRNKHSLRVENFKFLDTKQDNPNTQQGYTQSYNPYNQNNQMQNNQQNYNHNSPTNQTTQPQYQQPASQQNMVPQQEEKLPEIDINEDEIPF